MKYFTCDWQIIFNQKKIEAGTQVLVHLRGKLSMSYTPKLMNDIVINLMSQTNKMYSTSTFKTLSTSKFFYYLVKHFLEEIRK